MQVYSAVIVAATAGALILGTSGCAPLRGAEQRLSELPAAERCEALIGVSFGAGTVERAVYIQEGASTGDHGLTAPANFCRVTAHTSAGPGSRIAVEVWLPDNWNGKMYGAGGGGYSGGLDAAALLLRRPTAEGYAGVATDAGHPTSPGARWALGNPEQIEDWGHRGNHLGAVFARAAIGAYYGHAPTHAYFQGCSNGGRDAIMLARRYPDDYDGIIAGAAASDWTGMTSAFLWNDQVLFQTPGASGLTGKMNLVASAVSARCDARDGVTDGVLENPRACDFDPGVLACRGADGPNCLTPAEVAALRNIYRGPRTSDGRTVFSGVAMGNENIAENRSGWIDPGPEGTGAFGVEFFRWMVYQEADWTPARFNLDRDYATAIERLGPSVDAHDPDLSAFVRRGGRLILYHGWSDGRVQADASVNYYDAVRASLGDEVADQHVRLFMAPGMAHCFGGPGPNNFNMLSHLEAWVEEGMAPERVIATKYDNDLLALLGRPGRALRTRPLCAWPQTAHYTGSGSTDDETNFVCRVS